MGDDTEPTWERPRGRLGAEDRDEEDNMRELMPVRLPNGQWQRRKAPKRQQPAEPEAEAEPEPNVISEIEAAAAEVESAAAKRARIAKLSASILEAPQKHIGLLDELHEFASKDPQASVQRLALLSSAAVLRDIVPAYRVRPPTEKELQMQVSKEVGMLRVYEKKLLAAYEACTALLRKWLSSRLEAHRAAAVRGICALLDKAYDFNGRDELLNLLLPIAQGSDATLRADACAALVRMFGVDTHAEATLAAVKHTSLALKNPSASPHADVLGTWLHLQLGAVAAGAEPSTKRAKKRKRDMDPVARELAAAAGERGDVARVQTQILEHIFVAYARVLKRGAASPLLPAVLKGVAKFAHLVNVELLLDLLGSLRGLLNAEGVLSAEKALQCVHAMLQLLSGHGQALAVDTKDVHLKLYRLLTERSLLMQPSLLATALDCVEHLCRRNRSALLAPRAASMVRRLLGLACAAPPAQAIALLCAISRLHVAVPKLQTMLEPPEGGMPMHVAMLNGRAHDGAELALGGLLVEDDDMDAPTAIHSTSWQLAALRRHYHPTVVELASKLATGEPLPPRFLNATPLALMHRYSDAAGAFQPTPALPKPHRLAAALATALANGTAPPMLGAVGASRMENVREAEAAAAAAAGQPTGVRFTM